MSSSSVPLQPTVNFTCPDIDFTKAELIRITEDLKKISNTPLEDVSESITSIVKDLEVLCHKDLEHLRSQNTKLRKWGYELADEVSYLRTRLSELEKGESDD